MPTRVLIIGILFCLAGTLAACQMVAGALDSRFNLDFNVLLLPVGIGLFRGRKRSRWWARFWIVIGYVLFTAIILVCPFLAGGGHWSIYGNPLNGTVALPYILGVAVVSLLGLYVIHRLLYSPAANEYFKK